MNNSIYPVLGAQMKLPFYGNTAQLTPHCHKKSDIL